MTQEGTRAPRRGKKRYWLLGALAAAILLGGWLAISRPRIEPGTVLLIDLQEGIDERSPEGLARLVSGPVTDMLGLWRALRLAARDPRVDGVLLRVKPGRVGPGKVEELRALLARFRESGKFVVAHASAPDTLGYFLATAADEILLDRSTTLDAVGIRLSAYFLKDALAQLGVEADLLRVGDFKGAYEELALPGPTPELEESMNGLADSIYEIITQGVSSARSLEEGLVRQLFDRCPLPPDEALAAKLVDRLAEGEVVTRRLEERAGKEVHLASIQEYLARAGGGGGCGRALAVVHVLGTIVEGESRDLPVAGLATGADTVARALRDAVADPGVAGILLRIDSPGGVVSASEKIHQAVSEARRKKPLVASLAGSAASGGYYAACAAERVLAHSTTFTGSIGIFGGKIVLSELLGRLHVEARTYARGKRAAMNDFTRRYSTEERLALKGLLEESYRRFVDRVATGRKRTFEEVHAVAQGRVWTGRTAVGAGLVDQVGGLAEAIDALCGLAHLPASDPVEVRLCPPPASLWDAISGSRSGSRQAAFLLDPGAGLSEAAVLGAVDELREAGLLDGFARLALLPFTLKLE